MPTDLAATRALFLADVSKRLATAGQGKRRPAAAPHRDDLTRSQEPAGNGPRPGPAAQTGGRRMIDALVDVSRLDLGEQIELVRSPINLFEVVSRIAAEHQERAPRHRIQ